MWPDWLSALHNRHIVDVVDNDSRSTAGTFLGWPKDRVFVDVIKGGRADFAASHATLSPADKALLYARYNQPRHLDELIDAFTRLQSQDRAWLDRCTIIDLGCGPFTAGLAFASALGAHYPFCYYGIDRADSMLALGSKLHGMAQQYGALHPDTCCHFLDALDKIEHGQKHGRLTIVVASYLLASESFDAIGTVGQLANVLRNIGPGPAIVLYTNSILPARNIKFPEFSVALQQIGFRIKAGGEGIVYREARNPAALRYELFYRPATDQIFLEP